MSARRIASNVEVIIRFVVVPIAIILLLVAGHLARQEGESQRFIVHVLLEFAVGFLTYAGISWMVARFSASQNPLGIVRVFTEWRNDRRREDIKDRFENAERVNIIAVTLWNTLFKEEWFSDALERRIKDPRKTTEILLLDPDGNEIKRRAAQPREGDEGDLKERNQKSKELLETIISKSNSNAATDLSYIRRYLRLYDYSPCGNWMRFDDVGYVVLLTERGGYSPGLEVEPPGLLFKHYDGIFHFMWG